MMLKDKFTQHIAVVIGINDYGDGVPPLDTPIHDAEKLSKILKEKHGYEVISLLNKNANLTALLDLLEVDLPKLLTDQDRFLFYFAGHGIALNGDDGPEGYLVPQDSRLGEIKTYLKMTRVSEALLKLPCRHFLGILDCCFAGAFKWSNTRELMSVEQGTIHQERFDRFIQDPAWQIITSAASDQLAVDSFELKSSNRSKEGNHSPFAASLIKALEGYADAFPPAEAGKEAGDGVITASELYMYLRGKIEPDQAFRGIRQTPGLFPLTKHDKGEYIFLSPGHPLNLPPAPPLDVSRNPYRGLESFEEIHQDLFFGRQALTQKLFKVVKDRSLTVILGASGSGKSSLVKAGLIPQLRQAEGWYVLPPFRPGESPFKALNSVLQSVNLLPISSTSINSSTELLSSTLILKNWFRDHPKSHLLVVVDQLEELITLCRNEQERQNFLKALVEALSIKKYQNQLHLVLTLRSDFEAQFRKTILEDEWQAARFIVPAMTREELRQAVEEPASARVMYFDPHKLVEDLIDEVANMPGALPLLSFALSELYLNYLERQEEAKREGKTLDRAITQEDYEKLGGVTNSLTERAEKEYEKLLEEDKVSEHTIRNVMLRMVSVGGELARRRVPLEELKYADQENGGVQTIIKRFETARLLTSGTDSDDIIYLEPAHDALVRGWTRLLEWRRLELGNLVLQRELYPRADRWQKDGKKKQAIGLLWTNDPRLPQLRKLLNSKDSWLNQAEIEFVQRSSQRKTNEQRRLLSSVMVVILTLSGLTIYAFVQQGLAIKNEQYAITQRDDANRQKDEATKQRSEAEKQRKKATEQAKIALHNQKKAEANQREATKQAKIALTNQREATKQAKIALTNQREAEANQREATKQAKIALTNQREAEANQREATKQTKIALANQREAIKQLENSELNQANSLGRYSMSLAREDREIEAFLEAIRGGKILQKYRRNDREVMASLYEVIQHKRNEYNRYITFSDVFAITLDGKKIVSKDKDGVIKIWNLENIKKIISLNGHKGQLRSIAITPDGKNVVSADDDFTIKVWNLERGGEPRILPGHEAEFLSVAITPDGKKVVAGSWDNVINVWDLEKGGEPRTLIGHQREVNSVAITSDGKTVVSGSADYTIKVWNLEIGGEPRTLTGHESIITTIAITPDGKRIVSGSWDKTIRVWNLKRGGESLTLTGHQDTINNVAITPDAKTIVSGSMDGTVKVWDLEQVDKPRTFNSQQFIVSNVAITSDGKTVFSGGSNIIKVWNLEKVMEPLTLARQQDEINRVFISQDGKTFISGSKDSIKVWNLESKGEPYTLTSHNGEIDDVAITPDGKTVVVSSSEKSKNSDRSAIDIQLPKYTIKVWNLNKGLEPLTLTSHNGYIDSIAITPDGNTFVVSSSDRNLISEEPKYNIKIWNLEKGGKPISLISHQKEVSKVAISDNKILIVGGRDSIKIWNLENGEKPFVLADNENELKSISITPDGKTLISNSYNTGIKVWNLEQRGKPRIVIAPNDGSNLIATLTPDGKNVVTSDRETISVWNLENEKLAINLAGTKGSVDSIAVTPDGKIIVAASSYNISAREGRINSIKVWNLEQGGAPLLTLTGHENIIKSIAITPNGKTLVTGSADKRIKIWDLDLDSLMKRSCQWMWAYLHNPGADLSEQDRYLCDEVLKRK
jgi:WD40 repeat protein